jgi:hypothetical protein
VFWISWLVGGIGLENTLQKFIILSLHVLCGHLWRERNNRTFENVEHSVGQVIEFCMGSLFDWAKAWGRTTSTSIGGFLESLSYPYAL